MEPDQFHFSDPSWFLGLLIIPLAVALYLLFYKKTKPLDELKKFADPHLLPHLLKNGDQANKSLHRPLLLWSLAWIFGMVAMAGPRWNYTDVQTFKPEQDLVILLDLSHSMDVQDVKPSRIVRAQQEIGDLLAADEGISLGLVAYTAVPHMIAPLTDDMRTIANLLPALDTSLPTIQGNKLKPALKMAADMMERDKVNHKAILVVTSGDFEEDDIAALADAAKGAAIYTMGVGTAEGGPVSGTDGWLKDQNGKIVISKLQADRLQRLSEVSHGMYVEANYSDSDTKAILGRIAATADDPKASGKSTRVWEERFYIPAFLMGLLLLPWFRKGAVFPVIVFLVMMSLQIQPARADWADWFRNGGEQGKVAYDRGDYATAAEKFDTPYRRGVAQYKAKQFDKAEDSFNRVTDPKTSLNALYNKGNAQVMQKKYDDAIASYESVLKQKPDDKNAKNNLDIAKKLLEQQKKQPPQDKQKKDQKQQNQNQKSDNKSGQGSGGQQNKDQQQSNPGQQNGSQSQPQQNSAQGSQDQSKNGQQPQQGQQQAGQQSQGQGQKNQQGQQQKDQQSKGQDQQQQAGQQGSQQNQVPPQQGRQQPQQRQQQPSQQEQQNGGNQTGAEQKEEKRQPENGNAGAPPQDNSQMQQDRPAKDGQDQRKPRDVEADQWLNRIQSDPGSFLKNQFIIEDRQSGEQPEGDGQ